MMGASRLWTAYPQRLFPVQIIEPQAGDLAGTQPVRGQNQQDGTVAKVGPPGSLGGGEQT